MVWPSVFTATSDLWQEDNELVVWGKVRVREERVQVACERVSLYRPEASLFAPAEEPGAAPAEERPVETAPPVPVERRRLTVTLTTSDDPEADRARLRQVVALLRQFRGHDPVRLRIPDNGGFHDMALPEDTQYCDGLRERLVELVGEEALVLEPASPGEAGGPE